MSAQVRPAKKSNVLAANANSSSIPIFRPTETKSLRGESALIESFQAPVYAGVFHWRAKIML